MSIIPHFFDYAAPKWPRRLLDQNFGLALTPEDVMSAVTSPVFPRLSPWWPEVAQGVGSTIKADKDKWQINVDVQHFSPDEVVVKIVDGFIVVEGKHEEKKDEHGYISRQFTRKFKLPEDSNPDAVESRLSSDGVLTVVAPRKADSVKGERSVPITQTGPIRKLVDEAKPEVK
ncbi:protein lethal(2)essential for life-like [Ostrinia furnacalis]|uniref:protein lethal(2)essential for life-like n=1 Tax=Ostrinia furnacalis TaxID=93504 RepID=UPI00103EFF0B|nr:protein lethal(2)essential for life-like [Ostrinia furnacalis]